MPWRRLALVGAAVFMGLGIEASSVVVNAAANPSQTATASAANPYASPTPATSDLYTITTSTTASCAFDINSIVIAAPSNQTFANISGASTSLGSSTFTASSGSVTLTLSALECVGSASFTISLDGVNNTASTSGDATTTVTEYDGHKNEDSVTATLGTYNVVTWSPATLNCTNDAVGPRTGPGGDCPGYAILAACPSPPTPCSTYVSLNGVAITITASPSGVSEPNDLLINGVAGATGILSTTSGGSTPIVNITDTLSPDWFYITMGVEDGTVIFTAEDVGSWPAPQLNAQWIPAPAPTNAPIQLSASSSGSASFGQLSVTTNANTNGNPSNSDAWANLVLNYQTTFPDPAELGISVSSGSISAACPLIGAPSGAASFDPWIPVPSTGTTIGLVAEGSGDGSPTLTSPCTMSGIVTVQDHWNVPAGTYTVDLSAVLQDILYEPS